MTACTIVNARRRSRRDTIPEVIEDPALLEDRGFDQAKIGSERSFGVLFSAIFAVIGLWPLASVGNVRLWSLFLSGLMLLAALARPSLLRPLNRLWFQIGLLLGKVTTPVVMALLFFFVVTPVALLMRLFGKDTMRLKRGDGASSYWLARTPRGPQRGSMRDQF